MHFAIGSDCIEDVDGPHKWKLLSLVSIITATVCTVFACAGAWLRLLRSHVMGEQLLSQQAVQWLSTSNTDFHLLGVFCSSSGGENTSYSNTPLHIIQKYIRLF